MLELSERNKRIFTVILFVCAVIVIGYLLYFFFFKPQTPAPTSPMATPGLNGSLSKAGAGSGVGSNPSGPGALPSSGGVAVPVSPGAPETNGAPSRTTVLRDAITNSLSLSPSGTGVRSYNPLDGKFYRVLDDGTLASMSNQTFYNVQQVTWGNQTDKAVLQFNDGSKMIYNFSTQTQYSVPNYWQDFSFSPNDSSLAAKSVGNNENNRFLVVTDDKGGNAKYIEDIGNHQDDVHVSWSPNNQIIAYSFTGDPVGFDRQAIVMVGQHQENFKELMVEGRGFIPNWSPSGNNILYSVYSSADNFEPSLWVSGAVGDMINADRRHINLQTWADKCAWQNEHTIICGVPTSLPQGAGLQRETANTIPDTIERVDIDTGTVTNLGQPDGNVAVQQPVLSKDGQSLYFSDAQTGKLIKFSLAG